MSLDYSAVAWNGEKKTYDLVLAAGAALYLAVFTGTALWVHPEITAETLVIRAVGTLALLLLHVILAIGPLCRLHPAFLPLLYNRRHMGVTMFVLALGHGVFALIQFHAAGDLNPFLSLLTSHTSWSRITAIPFQLFGLLALFLLFAMASTSHDFWLKNLTAPVWKALHMLVYVAYTLLFAHVCFGALQSEAHAAYAVAMATGMCLLCGLHIAAGLREKAIDAGGPRGDGFVDVCGVDDIPEKRARIVMLEGERVAVFRYDGKISAVSNVCQHQNGPLGEGKIVAGCITCPWHGYQYLPDSGASPPPFTEKVPTFQVNVREDRVFVHPVAFAAGTRLEPGRVKAPCEM